MSLFANAKAKAVSGNMKEAFKNEAGAIDLASIMVGIIVIGLIGGVIAATVFAVIPWAQDNAAKQQLDSVAAAQSAYVGLTSDSTAIAFGNANELAGKHPTTGVVVAGKQVLFDATAAKVRVEVSGSGPTARYAAAKKSASGKVFYITDAKTQATDNAVVGATGIAATAVANAPS